MSDDMFQMLAKMDAGEWHRWMDLGGTHLLDAALDLHWARWNDERNRVGLTKLGRAALVEEQARRKAIEILDVMERTTAPQKKLYRVLMRRVETSLVTVMVSAADVKEAKTLADKLAVERTISDDLQTVKVSVLGVEAE
jgi:hypothetical protein